MLKYFFQITIASLAIIILSSVFAPAALAQDAAECEFGEFEMPLPGFEGCIDSAQMGEYLNLLAKFIIAMTVSAGLIMVVVAGYVYMTAGGSADRVSLAKKMIGSALLGIILALGSFIILNTINPNLVEFAEPQLNLPDPPADNQPTQ